MGDAQDNPALTRAPLRKTAYGRRVTSKTFTILGASTPEIRISTMGASRKRKIMDRPAKYKSRRASVSEMHNGSLHRNRLIARARHRYVSGNANDVSDFISQRHMTERVRSWDN